MPLLKQAKSERKITYFRYTKLIIKERPRLPISQDRISDNVARISEDSVERGAAAARDDVSVAHSSVGPARVGVGESGVGAAGESAEPGAAPALGRGMNTRSRKQEVITRL